MAIALVATILAGAVSGGDQVVAQVFTFAVMVIWAAVYNGTHARRVSAGTGGRAVR